MALDHYARGRDVQPVRAVVKEEDGTVAGGIQESSSPLQPRAGMRGIFFHPEYRPDDCRQDDIGRRKDARNVPHSFFLRPETPDAILAMFLVVIATTRLS
jgi:hypothetical protein